MCVCVCVCVYEGHSMNNFFHKCKLCIVWLWFKAKIISISKNICFEAIQNGGKSNRVLAAKQMLIIKLLVAEKCKPCGNYKRMSDMYGEICFSQRDVYKWAKHGFATTSL